MKSAQNFYAEHDDDDPSFAGDIKEVQLVAANPPIRMNEKIPLFNRIPSYVRMLDHSTRRRDFDEINFIGDGAFSSVYSAVHRLDGRRYALKKLTNISSRTALRHAREEIAVLSRLEHPNVVRYYTCWIEADIWPPTSSDPLVNKSSQARVSLAEDEGESEDSSLASTDHSQGRFWTVAGSSVTTSSPSSSFNSTSNSSGPARAPQVSDEEEMQLAVPRPASRLRLPKPSLFIQMDFCHSTLEDWLRQRNSQLLCTNELPTTATVAESGLSEAETLLRRAPWSRLRHAPVRWLFDQIVNGVQYLHQNGVLHRDLKPANVFLMGPPLSCISERPCLVKHCAQLPLAKSDVIYSTDHFFCYHLLRPKIGDFGLSTVIPPTSTLSATADFHPPGCTSLKALPAPISQESVGQQQHQQCQPSNQLVSHSAFLTGNLGTLLYAAPEVIDAGHGRSFYGFKADIYSLGVIFFQMLYPCATESELVSHLVRFQQSEKLAIAASPKGKGAKKRRNQKTKQHLLPREVTLLWPEESPLLSRMLSFNAERRPDADELLEKLCLTSEVPEIARCRGGSLSLPQDCRSRSAGPLLSAPSLVDQLVLRNRALEQQVASLARRLAFLERKTRVDKSVP
ncbi:Eukaryotic translation initiation factor 2-alpha kinase [Sparganum proliferum]